MMLPDLYNIGSSQTDSRIDRHIATEYHAVAMHGIASVKIHRRQAFTFGCNARSVTHGLT